MSNNNATNTALNYAKSEQEATDRHIKNKSKDPFHDILPALLNSADIADYVAVTGMIFPFDPENLKSASYEMLLGGQVIHWNTKDKTTTRIDELKNDQEIVFNKNSITFVTVNAKFRLPDYIALRFNLQIEHVHRGLLLGTGPLVNPGFCGKLMIPIHNLTNNDYKIKQGDSLIGVEFTKISPNKDYTPKYNHSNKRKGSFIANKRMKDNKTFEDFLRKALPFGIATVKSSISDTLHRMQNSLDENKAVTVSFKRYSIVGGLGLFIALISLIWTSFGVINDVNKYVSDATMVFQGTQSSLYQLHDLKKFDEIIKNEPLRKERLDSLASDISIDRIFLLNKIEVLESRLREMEYQLNTQIYKNKKEPNNLKPSTEKQDG